MRFTRESQELTPDLRVTVEPLAASREVEDRGIAPSSIWSRSTSASERHLSCIIGYHRDGYPERLDPVILPFELARSRVAAARRDYAGRQVEHGDRSGTA